MSLTATSPVLRARILDLPAEIAYRWRRRKFHASKKCCPLCSDELATQANELIIRGFYAASVTATRLRIELILGEFYQRVVTRMPDGERRPERRTVRFILRRMVVAGEITPLMRRRIQRLYTRASSVVHGSETPTRAFARLIQQEADAVIARMKGGVA